jgi:adenosylcobinamide kinase/adenosylcobinamide-phosphate guanylyltransferase
MAEVVFITGGARSGKSSLALRLASAREGKRAFVATMQPLDEESAERIKKHRLERGDQWKTYEEPIEVAKLLRELTGQYDVVIFDCLTLWLSNLMLAGKDVRQAVDDLIEAISGSSNVALYIVSNEVGMGIVPENELARRFRDEAGHLNQKMAALADRAFMSVSGLSVTLK